MRKALDAFYGNAIVYLGVVAALGALAVFIGQGTVAAFLFMLLGMMIIMWDAHTDSHIPEAPSLN